MTNYDSYFKMNSIRRVKTMNNFETILPENYQEVFHIDVKNNKTGLILNLIALLIAGILIAIAFAILFLTTDFVYDLQSSDTLYFFAFLGILILYVIAHELVHGIAYKSLTKQKLTFGIKWSCAFCGVPNIYVSRKTAMIALILPFAVFTPIFTGILVWLYFYQQFLYFYTAILLALHGGGCIGDLYVFLLFLFKFKDKTYLMRDTGPEQFIYQLQEEKE